MRHKKANSRQIGQLSKERKHFGGNGADGDDGAGDADNDDDASAH